ncbi:MAG: DedA family protein [Acidimicrobiia bacterium]
METFLASLEPWVVYVVIGALTFGESAAFLGLILPGEVGLVAAAAVASVVGIDPVMLAVVAASSASAGGVVGYEVGRRYGRRLAAWAPIARRLGGAMGRMADRIAMTRSAMTLVIIGRFNQVTRAAVPALAGMAPISRLRFAAANVIGAILWSVTFTAVGFLAAEWWRDSSGPFQAVLAASLAAVIRGWMALTRVPGVANPT